MSTTARIFFLILVLLFSAFIVHFLIKRRLNLKYTLTWLFAAAVMLAVLAFPSLIGDISHLVGIELPVNAVFVFSGMFALAIIFTLTIIVSHLNTRLYKLSQTQALLEKRIRELEKDALKKDE